LYNKPFNFIFIDRKPQMFR